MNMKAYRNCDHLSYSDIYDIIAKYANHMIPSYADHWNRFPTSWNAYAIISELEKSLETWGEDRNQHIANQINNAIDTIKNRMGK